MKGQILKKVLFSLMISTALSGVAMADCTFTMNDKGEYIKTIKGKESEARVVGAKRVQEMVRDGMCTLAAGVSAPTLTTGDQAKGACTACSDAKDGSSALTGTSAVQGNGSTSGSAHKVPVPVHT